MAQKSGNSAHLLEGQDGGVVSGEQLWRARVEEEELQPRGKGVLLNIKGARKYFCCTLLLLRGREREESLRGWRMAEKSMEVEGTVR